MIKTVSGIINILFILFLTIKDAVFSLSISASALMLNSPTITILSGPSAEKLTGPGGQLS